MRDLQRTVASQSWQSSSFHELASAAVVPMQSRHTGNSRTAKTQFEVVLSKT